MVVYKHEASGAEKVDVKSYTYTYSTARTWIFTECLSKWKNPDGDEDNEQARGEEEDCKDE